VLTKKTINVELSFHGDGTIVKNRGSYFGSVADPDLADNIRFSVHREALDEDGLLNPVPGEATVEGAFQVNVYGNREGYRELGRYLLALSELDTTVDPEFHAHFDKLKSFDDRTTLHIIFRKSESLS
jgi:hypothetical protein